MVLPRALGPLYAGRRSVSHISSKREGAPPFREPSQPRARPESVRWSCGQRAIADLSQPGKHLPPCAIHFFVLTRSMLGPACNSSSSSFRGIDEAMKGQRTRRRYIFMYDRRPLRGLCISRDPASDGRATASQNLTASRCSKDPDGNLYVHGKTATRPCAGDSLLVVR